MTISLAQLKRNHAAAVKEKGTFMSFKNGYCEYLDGFEEAQQKQLDAKALVRERILSDLKKN